MYSRSLTALLMLLTLFFSGCLEDPTTEDLDAAEVTAQGWEYFESAETTYPLDSESLYCRAIEKFELAAYMDTDAGDAYNGLGWSYMRINLEADAILNFNRGLSCSEGEVRREIAVGFGSLLLQENDMDKAESAKVLLETAVFGGGSVTPLESYTPYPWLFSHDVAISSGDVHLNLALAYLYTHRNSADPDAVLGTSDDPPNAPTCWGQYYIAEQILGGSDVRVIEMYDLLIAVSEI